MLEEGVGDHRHERMAMKALPGSALEVIEAEFFFHLLMGLFADPSRLEGATTPTLRITGHLFASLPVAHAIPPRFVLADASAPGRVEDPPRAGIIGQPAIQLPACSQVDVSGTLRFPGNPSCAFASVCDPGRTDVPSPVAVSPVLPLLQREQRLQRAIDFGATAGLQHLLSTLHE